MEREITIPPIQLYIETQRLKQATWTRDHPVKAKISQAADAVWTRMRDARQLGPRPPIAWEAERERAIRLTTIEVVLGRYYRAYTRRRLLDAAEIVKKLE